MSSIVEEAIVRLFAEAPAAREPIDLPSYPMGPARVDISDRNALYDFLDGL